MYWYLSLKSKDIPFCLNLIYYGMSFWSCGIIPLILDIMSDWDTEFLSISYFYILTKNFWAWDLTCAALRVCTTSWTFFHLIPNCLRPCRNFLCSSCVHFPSCKESWSPSSIRELFLDTADCFWLSVSLFFLGHNGYSKKSSYCI